ncbi:unnamed protein product [Adineta ricciae]|uniref:Protein kinase domain-containing protein n=1 Tax=Adineta ricciae TaxID=249248 RepID=A0A814J1U9_ADIRI|nr:unnamed protein product [Adineta ricciae]CAF1385476.1 unnamed protein product [Adineta ricciae]
MLFTLYVLLSCLSCVHLIIPNTWSSTSTNCVWHFYTSKDHFSKRIDLRDIRNQLLTVSLNDSSYYFNPCKTFNFPINVDPHTVKGEQCHNVLGCKRIVRLQNDSEYYTVAIRMNSMVLPQTTLLTTRYYGSKSYANQTVDVECECNRRVHRAQLRFVKYGQKQMPIFSLTHRCCCPNVCGVGNAFPKELLLVLLFVIFFIIGTAIWIFFQCRRHYPERNTYGAIATTDMNINTLEPSQVLKISLPESNHRNATVRRPRSRSIVPVLENSTISSQDFKVIKRLGVGELGGEVCEGRWNDKLVAVKTLRIGVHPEKFSQNDKAYLENEIGLLSHVRHKNLTAVIGICFDIDIYPRILLSFAEHGTIIDFIRRFPTKVDWSLRLSWCVNTTDALAYLHQAKILHRNLKSSNLLIGVDLRVHVCDYGLMPILQPLRQACDSERCLCRLSHPSLPVSIRWSAPEILSNPSDSSRFTPACDVYSFGVCLWEQVRLEQPYAEIKDEAEVSRMIVEGVRLTPFEDTATIVMPDYNQIMKACWSTNPTDRPTFDSIGQLLRGALPKVKQFQKMSMRRFSSTTYATDIQEEHSALVRLDSRLSTDTSKSPNMNV